MAFDVLPTSDGKKAKVSVRGEMTPPPPPTDSKAYNSLFSPNPEVVEGLINIEPTNGIFGRESNATYSSTMSDSTKKEVALQLDGYFSSNKKLENIGDSFKLKSTQEQLNKNPIKRECDDLKDGEKIPLGTLIDCWKKIEIKQTAGTESSAAQAKSEEKPEKKPVAKHHSAVKNASSKDKTPETPKATETKATTEEKTTANTASSASAKPAEAPKADKPADTPKTDKPAETAKIDIPPPPAPAQIYNEQYYQPQLVQQPRVSYGPSPAQMMGTSALAGGVAGGLLGFLFGGTKGFFSGSIGGALGGLMGFCGMSAFGGGFGDGFDCGAESLNGPLNLAFANFYNSVSFPQVYPMSAMPMQPNQPVAQSSLPELTDENFDKNVKNSKTPVVVEFVMEGSEFCAEQAPILDQFSKDYLGKVQVYQVNVNKAEAKRAEYGVGVAPTVLVFKDGKVDKKLIGLTSKEELAEALNENPPA